MNYSDAVSKARHFFFLVTLICTQGTYAQPTPASIPQIMNSDAIAKELGLATRFKNKSFSRKIKIAILDNGFAGYEAEAGKTLPKDIKDHYHGGKASDADTIGTPSFHGLFMAQLVELVLQKSGAKVDHELHLFNSYGYTKFEDAVETVIKENFDVVLYSQVWEYGGNGDGKGFINALVDKAVKAGIIWINAAGNFSLLTRLAPVDGKVDGTDEWVVFKDSHGQATDGVTIVCGANKKEKCGLRLVLSWNSFKDDPKTGTDKDLDLFLFDSKKQMVSASQRNQKLVEDSSDPLTSLIPRELIESQIDPGVYTAKVKIKSKNFSASQDQLRITASGYGVTMVDPTAGETLLPPADNPGVITVGASDDPHTSVSKSTNRPDVSFKSAVRLKDGSVPFSTSNAAAFGAGLTALYLGTGTDKTRDAVLTALKSSEQKPREPVPLQTPPPKNHVRIKPDNPNPPPAPNAPPHPTPPQAGGQSYPPYSQQYPQSGYDNGYYGPPPPTGFYPQPPQGGPSPYPAPPQRHCLMPITPPFLYPAARDLLMQGGAVGVDLGYGRTGIVFNYNFAAVYGIRLLPGQRLFLTPQGPVVLGNRQLQTGVPPSFYELIIERVAVCESMGWYRQ